MVPSGTLAAATSLSLTSYPHIKAGDVVTYELSGNKPIATPLTWSTELVADNNSSNLTADLVTDGIPDLFQEGSSIDVNAWQYEKLNNATMNWYQFRFSPSFVNSSIQVYDKNGGAHILQAGFMHTGTAPIANGVPDHYDFWDLVWRMESEDGELTDGVITGLQFDGQGRYTGSSCLGATAHGTSLADSNIYVGTPAGNSISVNWATAGPATIHCDFGDGSVSDGLTGDGAVSDAAATSQDGDPSLVGSQRLLVRSPAHAAGPVDVRVTTSEGAQVLPQGYMYLSSSTASVPGADPGREASRRRSGGSLTTQMPCRGWDAIAIQRSPASRIAVRTGP